MLYSPKIIYIIIPFELLRINFSLWCETGIMKNSLKQKLSKKILSILYYISLILKYIFTISTIFTVLIYIAVFKDPQRVQLIDFIYTYQNNVIYTIIVLFVLFILSFFLEIIFAPEIGKISWKNTLALTGVILLLFIFWIGKLKFNTSLLVPIFSPIFLISFWYYFSTECKLIKNLH